MELNPLMFVDSTVRFVEAQEKFLETMVKFSAVITAAAATSPPPAKAVNSLKELNSFIESVAEATEKMTELMNGAILVWEGKVGKKEKANDTV